MPSSDSKVRVYEELADWEHQHGSPQAHDRFLILAADAALTGGLTEEAERFRARLLKYNPHHLLRPYPSLAAAMKSSDVYSYIADLRGSYPLKESEQLLESLKASDKPAGKSEGVSPVPDMPPPPEPFRGYQLEPTTPAAARDDGGGRPPLFAAPPESEPASPAAARKMLDLRHEVSAPSPPSAPVEEMEETAPSGASVWMSDALFVLFGVAALALAVYTFARPFLPLPDAPLR